MEFETFMRRRLLGGRAAAGVAGAHGQLRERLGGERELDRAERRRERAADLRARPPAEAPPPPPPPVPVPSPSSVRREQLGRWLRERRAQKSAQAQASRRRPPFRAGRVAQPSAYRPPPPLPAPRRSARLRALDSFAPVGATFRAPLVRKLARTPAPVEKNHRRKPTIFSARFHQTDVLEPPSTEIPVGSDDPNATATTETTKPPPPLEASVFATSPFVKSTRGKSRTSRMSEICKQTPAYFRKQLDGEIARLLNMCDEWKTYGESHDLEEDGQDSIDLAVGQTRLLVDKKFRQFRGLIDRCENGTTPDGEGPVEIQDLQGFWDMIYMQVVNLDIRFNNLKSARNRDWKEARDSPPKKKTKPKIAKKKVDNAERSRALRELIRERRQKSQRSADDIFADSIAEEGAVRFDGGFYAAISPAKAKSDASPESNARVSTRRSISSTETEKLISSQNGERISVYLNKTPGKSILKTPVPNVNLRVSTSTKKNVKILFSDEFPQTRAIEPRDKIVSNDTLIDAKIDRDENPSKRFGKSKRRSSKRDPILIRENISPASVVPSKNIITPAKIQTPSTEEKKILSPIDANAEFESERSGRPVALDDSYLKMIGLSSYEKRKSRSLRQSEIRKSHARLSDNLIKLDSPPQPVYITRSILKKYSKSPINIERDSSQ